MPSAPQHSRRDFAEISQDLGDVAARLKLDLDVATRRLLLRKLRVLLDEADRLLIWREYRR